MVVPKVCPTAHRSVALLVAPRVALTGPKSVGKWAEWRADWMGVSLAAHWVDPTAAKKARLSAFPLVGSSVVLRAAPMVRM